MTSRPLDLLHMNLFGLTKTKCLSRNCFVFILADDFSRFTWVFFLEHKDEAFSCFNVFRKRVEKEDFSILRIKSDRGGEFINHSFITYCKENGIKNELLCPRTPQKNSRRKEESHSQRDG